MAKAKNKVIAGAYEGKTIIAAGGKIQIVLGFLKTVDLDSKTVSTYEVLSDEHIKSAASGAARGIVGGVLLGPVGMLAGGLSAKSNDVYEVAIQFNNGEKSLLEIDGKRYKMLIKNCF